MAAFDYLVVGSGSAADTLASRLSEDAARRVLLLRAGSGRTPTARPSRGLTDGGALSKPASERRSMAEIIDGRRIVYPRGKLTGSSSAVDATLALRGTPQDFGEWAALGNPAWSWEHVRSFYQRLEDDLDHDDDIHGRGGPVPIRRWRPDEFSPCQQSFLQACRKAGFPETDDHNHPAATGVGPAPACRRDPATPWSTVAGYLGGTVRSRANLTVRSVAHVNRVLFAGGRARGVEVTLVGGGVEGVAGDTVVLAAGALTSPAILLRSGIGPASDLRRLGIAVREDRAGVGADLIDRPRTGAFMVPEAEPSGAPGTLVQTVLRTTAPGSARFNDLQYHLVDRLDLALSPDLRRVAAGSTVFGVVAVHQKPRSRGRIVLTAADPASPPDVVLNFLAAESDADVLVDAARTCWELVQAPGVAENGRRPVVLGDDMVDDDEMMRDYVRLSIDSGEHPAGTARMGAASDDSAVVSERLAVHGADNLYIADASVMPSMVSGSGDLTSIMLGERLAHWLRTA
ncbi:GMC family oxidoreductase [Actinoplanes campanulatus]|nr:GMC family oxidoreductase N-terminal domain-containing protein [Actinoplanes capillaceus]